MPNEAKIKEFQALPAGPDLDRIVGALLYGKEKGVKHPDLGDFMEPFGVPEAMAGFGWSPSTNARHAEVILYDLQSNWGVTINGIWTGGWSVKLGEAQREGGVRYGEGRGDTMPLAICRAIVEAFLSR